MRIVLTTLSLTAALAAGACASGPPAEGSYVSQERKLADDCQARGGILAPTGQITGRPETEHVCKINALPARVGG